MRNIIDGFITVHQFGRRNDKPEFTYFGTGRVVNCLDNFTGVFNKGGSHAFCPEFELNCRDALDTWMGRIARGRVKLADIFPIFGSQPYEPFPFELGF